MIIFITDAFGDKHEMQGYYSNSFIGYGHHRITLVIHYGKKTRKFKIVTADMPWIDALGDYKFEHHSFEDQQAFYHERWIRHFADLILEWLEN